eukprot:49786-Prymnesium_polylepis.3
MGDAALWPTTELTALCGARSYNSITLTPAELVPPAWPPKALLFAVQLCCGVPPIVRRSALLALAPGRADCRYCGAGAIRTSTGRRMVQG